MWLVDRQTRGLESGREIAPPLRDTLRLWYMGEGTVDDEAIALFLVQHARREKKWFACACRGVIAEPPLLSPAFLVVADTYYLRRLTGTGRTTHTDDCPYYRDQAPARVRAKLTNATPRNPVGDYFQVMRPIPAHLAQVPTSELSDDQTRGASVPKLARLTWELIETSRRHIILPISMTLKSERRSIAGEFRAVRTAAKHIQVAPGVCLADVLFTHSKPFTSGAVVARLTRMEANWPSGHAPQAFLLLFTTSIRGNTLMLPSGLALTTKSRISSPSSREKPVTGPFLTLVVVGKHPDDHRYDAISAYAQPIHSGMRFVPVKSNVDRTILHAIDQVRWALHRQDVDIQVTVPIFHTMIDHELVRPDFVIDAMNRETGEVRTIILVRTTSTDTPSDEPTNRKRAALASIGTLLAVDNVPAEKVGGMILDALGMALDPSMARKRRNERKGRGDRSIDQGGSDAAHSLSPQQ